MQTIMINQSLTRGQKPLFECPEGFIIAGGAIRRWYSGEPQDGDIDLFCSDSEIKQKWMDEKKLYLVYESKLHSTYKIDNKIIQVIHTEFNTLEELFAKFDFHHCCWAWNNKFIFTTAEALICTERKHLALNNPQPGFEMDTLRRTFKYQRSGYSPCAGTLIALAKMLRNISSDEEVQNQVEISPGGGQRIIRFD